MRMRIHLAVLPAIAGTLLLAGCAGSTPDHSSMSGMDMPSTSTSSIPSSTGTDGAHNDADVMFATMMIPHHAQAVQMADMLLAKPDADPKVRALAQRIKAAQSPEITEMNRFLTSWGAPAVAPTPMTMGGMSDGMMSGDDMAELEHADGKAASTLFLRQMMQHHRGAITMADAERRTGASPAAKTLAARIVTAQTSEIDLMRSLLASL
ncbi:DUF305 domain-containing protein [Amnibacterium sp. CER49]|uniref:DUF305 domain-containing protein n=1 Tax=Amnibacterium sp. CER49 TaxID=3039161 RepID=UPI002449AB12|nr:DUF305 domain-containing protein [Amnibacterium sp. CER49]MDH2442404.1 DUF305 domain-containing protein [Amnibacterium sp. CER49]